MYLKVYHGDRYSFGWLFHRQGTEYCHGISAFSYGKNHTRPLLDALNLMMDRIYQRAVANNAWQHVDAVHLIAEIVDGNADKRMGPLAYLMEWPLELQLHATTKTTILTNALMSLQVFGPGKGPPAVTTLWASSSAASKRRGVGQGQLTLFSRWS